MKRFVAFALLVFVGITVVGCESTTTPPPAPVQTTPTAATAPVPGGSKAPAPGTASTKPVD